MAKEALKIAGRKKQGELCALSGKRLAKENALVDTDRIVPRSEGGTYTDENTRIVNPVDHQKRHGNHRERTPEMQRLKSLIDDRNQILKLTMKINNQLLAYERCVDHPTEATKQWLQDQLETIKPVLAEKDRQVLKEIKDIAKTNSFVASAMNVRGVGFVTVAYCLVYIDLTVARHASSLWKYAGLDKPKKERYEKGVASGGNKTLRTILYNMACSQIKANGNYRYVYDQVKTRLENSEKIVTTMTMVPKEKGEGVGKKTEGKWVELPWKDAKPSHRHGAALRAVMKHFLADYWMEGRKYLGLEVGPLYPEAMLGGNHRTIMPQERGWA